MEVAKNIKIVTVENNTMKKKVILSVTNDLYTDPRVDKVSLTLSTLGYDVLLVGRCYGDSPLLADRMYQTKRLRLIFRKGFLFYAAYNIRLFFYLCFQKCDVLVANDLDTLLPNVLVSKLRNKKLVYDSHEYFCGILELKDRAFVRNVWKKIEKWCFPKLEHIITVSQSIAEQYSIEYNKDVKVVRNIPSVCKPPINESKESLNLPTHQTILILQGNAIHKDRGGEEIIEAMPLIENAFLLVIGSGDVIPDLKQRTAALQISDRVRFIDRISPEKLFNYTYFADIGIAFDKDVSLNHFFSLPNKIFDYIRAETPYLSSNLPERKFITEKYGTGVVLLQLTPQTIADTVNKLIEDKDCYQTLKENCKQAATELTWENEEKIVKEIYGNLFVSD